MSSVFLILGCSIYLLLGGGHLAATIFTKKFHPQDSQLLELLKVNSSNISDQTNIWNGLVGFHMSHSLGLIIFGTFYIVLALENYSYFLSSVALNIGFFLIPAIYIVLAHKHWFSVPRNAFILSYGFLLLSSVLR